MKITEAALEPLLYRFSVFLLYYVSTETKKKKHLNMMLLKLSAFVYLSAKILQQS